MKKKHLFTAFLLLCSAVAVAHNFEADGIYYNIIDDVNKTVEVTYKGYDAWEIEEYIGNVIIPEKVSYDGQVYTVVGIGESAFMGCENLTGIVIPKSITEIGEWAFEDCTKIESIVVDAENKNYDSRNNCNALIETSTKTLLVGCKNTKIPDGVEIIEEYAFYLCEGLTELYIPESVKNIKYGAFIGCSAGLKSIAVDVDNEFYDSRNDCNALIETSTNTLLLGCTNSTIPGGITSIKDAAFFGTSLTGIAIPNSVKKIGTEAFANSGLKSIEIPDSVTDLGYWTFNGCTSLENVSLSNSILVYGAGIFEDCISLENVTIPDGATVIGDDMFRGCTSLVAVTIPGSVTNIEDGAFRGCISLANIEIPNSVNSIGSRVFEGTAWYANQPDGVLYIGNFLLGYKGDMPENTHIDVKEGTENICSGAFEDCFSLVSIEIPNSVTIIGNYAFDNTAWYENMDDGIIYINNVLYKYKGAMPENTSVKVKEGTVSISDYAFFYEENLSSVEFPSTLDYIGFGAFEYCTSLESVVLPDGVTAIDDQVFGNCSSLVSIEIPNSVTSIGRFAFYDCTSLANATVPNGISIIREGMFSGCESLVNVIIPDAVTIIKYGAFCGCSNLTDIVIGKNVTSIEDDVFAQCTALENVTSYIPSEKLFILDSSVFYDVDTHSCNLYVPFGTKELYASTADWNRFGNIVELEGTGIDNVLSGDSFKSLSNVSYDLSGRVVENSEKGIYIINGKKVLVK